MNRKIKGQKGFLLIESIVAIFVLTVGIVAATGMFNMSGHSARANAEQIVALNLARGQSEYLQSGNSDYISKITTSDSKIWLDPELKSNGGAVTFNNRDFHINTTITKNVQGNLAKAEVTVSWVDVRKKSKEITFVSWFFPQ